MAGRSSGQRSDKLFQFDQPYLEQYGALAGVDEVGRGPLAGPVVAAAVILAPSWRHPALNDSKQVSPKSRQVIYDLLKTEALAIGVGIVGPETIDRINIRQASFLAMRQALEKLAVKPAYVLVDGFPIPHYLTPHRGIVKGDALSAHIAAASIIAKVTRDAMMEAWDPHFPVYGFARHKGYGAPEHLEALRQHGPCPLHRRSFAPVRESLPALSTPVRE